VDARHKAGHDAVSELRRYVVTPTVAKHRLSVWTESAVCPDHQLIVIARDDDASFGVLHSHFHDAWSLRLGTWLGVGNDPRYTPATTFETFPSPEGLTPNIPAADYADDPRAQRIAAAAKRLDELRRAWLNPPDLVDIVPEVTPTAAPGEDPRRYPDRIVPKTAEAAVKLKERTLTNLYNQRPQLARRRPMTRSTAPSPRLTAGPRTLRPRMRWPACSRSTSTRQRAIGRPRRPFGSPSLSPYPGLPHSVVLSV
jgi:hypothetical protein